jgi:hypothetical protein
MHTNLKHISILQESFKIQEAKPDRLKRGLNKTTIIIKDFLLG